MITNVNIFDTNNLGNIGATPNMAINFNVEIVALTLSETGTYNDHFARSYKANMSHDDVNGVLATVAQSNMNTRGTVFSGLASNILDVDARVNLQTDLINIPNGWGTSRFRFMLQIRETSLKFAGCTYYTYIQGFSESQDVSLQTSQINTEMRFFINNFVRIQETIAQTAQGPRTSQKVVKSGQVLNGVLLADQSNQVPTFYMRPSDVIGKIQTEHDSELKSGDVYDIRNTNIGGSNSVFNSYDNNTATQYFSRLITPMVDSVRSIGFGPGNGGMVDNATSLSLGNEPSYNDSPFMTLLMRRSNVVGAATFSMAELAALDPTVGSRTTLRPVAKEWVQQGLSSRGNSEWWHSATPETVFAVKLINAVPGFMWQNYIGAVSFSMSNGFSGGRVELTLSHLMPITNFAPQEYVSAFLRSMEEMVARDISYNGNVIFAVHVNASILGDVNLQVSLNGGPSVPYTAPAFGSGVLNPVYTHDQGSFNKLASNMQSVMTGLEAIYKESSDFSGNGSMNPNI